jgi:hypothetical protein
VVLQGMSPRKFWKVFHTIRKLICKFLLLLWMAWVASKLAV